MFSRTSVRFSTALLTIIVITSMAYGASWRDLFGLLSSEPAQEISTSTEPAFGVVVKTVCDTGTPDLASIAAAVTDANTNFPTGGVTYNVCAGLVETAPAGGYTLTASGALGDEIVFQKSGMGANPTITANAALTAGALNDGLFKIIGGDYVTIDGFTLQENAANTTTTAASNNMTEWGVAVLYATTTNNSQNITIRNNTIDLNRTYQNTFGIYANATHTATTISTSATGTGATGGNSGLKVYSNNITDVNLGIVVVGPTAAADNNDGIDIGGASIATGNTITNFGTTGTFSSYANVSGTNNGILVRNSKNFNISFNTITSSVGGITAGTTNGIQIPAFSNAPTGTFTNNINNNSLSLQPGASVTLNGINIPGTSASATSVLNINNNDFTALTYTVASSSATTAISNVGSTSGPLTHSISGNTFTNLTSNTTGSFTFIGNSWARPTNGVANVNNNSVVTGFNKTGAGGTVTLYTSNSTSGPTINEINTGNNFSNMTFTGATSVVGWRSTDGGTPIKTVTNNTFSNWVGGTSAVTGLAVSFSGSGTVSGNQIFGITCACSIIGFETSSGIQTISRNKIYGLESTAAAPLVAGALISGGTTVNFQNNLIGDLRAPSASATDAIRGINITSTTATSNINVSYNTIFLNASSAGANFGTTGIFHTTSATATTAALNMRNNNIVNLSTAAGTGLTVAYRRSTTALTNYGTVSNNNNLYAGTPSATNLVFSDGTNNVQTMANYITLAGVSPRDSASISANPVFVSTTGSNANFLHINTVTPTQLESGGTPIAGITDDYDGDTRNGSTPDIGADEFTGVLLDLVGPAISYSNLLNTSSTGDRVLNIAVTDASGVPVSGAGLPVIYYRKNAGAYVPTQCSFVAGSNYSCSIVAASLGGLAVADVVSYYVVAQDTVNNVSANPSGGAGGFTVNPPAAATPPTTPNQYSIVPTASGSFNVGSGETYTSLTNTGGIFEFLNNSEITGNVTINITSDLLAETGTAPLNQFSPGFTVLIRPSGAARVVSGSTSANAMIRTVGASNVVIDGSTSGGTDRSLTITNSSITTPQVVRFGSVGTSPATGNTLKNTIINNGANTSSAVVIAGNDGLAGYFNNVTIQNNDIRKAFVGVFGNAAVLAGNGSGTIYTQNKVDNSGADAIRIAGLYMQGIDGGTISNNVVGNFDATVAEGDTGIWLATGTVNTTVASNSVSGLGMTTAGAFTVWGIRDSAGATASGNNITQNTVSALTPSSTTTSGPGAIGIDTSSGGTTIQRNDVSNINSINTGTFGAAGINIAAGNNVVIKNNFVSGVTGDMTGGAAFSTTFGIFGIRIVTGTGHQIYHNSVNLYGARAGTATTSLLTAALAVVSTGSTGMDIRNNIFANNITGGTTSIANVAVYLPSGGTSTMALTMNRNSYYYGTDVARQGAGQGGTTAGTNFFTNLTALKAYTSTLGSATNDDASIESTGAVPFTSSSDLHLLVGSPEINTGFDLSAVVNNDYDGNGRQGNLGTEIGADEIADLNAPDTSILTNPTNPSNSTSAAFTFSGTDTLITPTTEKSDETDSKSGIPTTSALAGFECRIDGGSYAACTSPQNYTGLSQGSHTFDVRAKDANNNVDPTPASFTWVVDSIVPDTTITANPTNPTNSTGASFSFTGSDPGGSGVAGFQCQIDGGGFSACTSPQTYTGLADGSHTFQVRAVDAAGNIDPTPASYTWVIDTAPPNTTILTNPANPINSSAATFTFSSTEGGSTFECQIDGGGYSSCTSPKTYTGLADGSHTFQVRAIDGAGNVDPTPASYTWVIDTTAPDTTITANPTNPSASTSASFSFTGSDTGGSGVASFECKLDAGAFAACTSPQAYSGLSNGSHTFEVRAKDNAGNTDASPASFTWVVDATAPDTTITSNPTNPSTSTSATFTFTGSDPVAPQVIAGFECKLDAGAFAACTSPQNYAGLSIGSHTFEVRAIDTAGNVDPTPASFTWTITGAGIGGTIPVGTGETYTSLTNTGGLFEAINTGPVTSNITINITSDLTGETGTVALNEIAGGFTVLIKPTGAARSITGSSTVGIIRINSADGVTIDGSLSGGTATGVGGDAMLRNLTIQNTSTTATSGGVVIVMTGTNGANNFTIKNTNVSGQDPTQTLLGIHIGGATPGASPTTVPNLNSRVENCSVQKAILGIFNNGMTATPATGTVITRNNLSATGASRLRRGGIFFFNQNGIQVTENSIGGIDSNESADSIGIIAGIQNVNTTATATGGVSNALIARNRIIGITASSTVGFSAVGIAVAGGTLGPNTIVNNMVSGVVGPATSPDIVAGIFVAGVTGSDTRVYNNSVALSGDRGAVATQIGSYGIAVSGATPTVDIRNNSFYNAQTSGGGANAKSYAIGTTATAFGTFTLNNNDHFATGANFGGWRRGSLDTTGTDAATLADWQTATSQEAASISSDPLYVSLTDLHIQPTSPLLNVGATIAAVTDDFDSQSRPQGAAYEIGADEIALMVASADLSITKTDGVTTATPGGSVTYTITASNAGPDPVTGATVADTFPAVLTATWTCVGAGGGTCTAAGSGNINDTVNLPVGGSVTYTASAAISASATGTLANTATVSSSTADPNPANNSATDVDTLSPQADLSITKTDGVTTVTPGGTTTYTIVASNSGPSNAPGSTVADTFPASITAVSWTCVGAGGGTCTAAGTGNINDTVNLPAGGSVTFTAVSTISGSATGTIANTATVSSSVTDPAPANNSATDTDTVSVAGGNFSINDVRLNEGNSGSATATFTVTYTAGGAAAVNFGTANVTATAGTDYATSSGTLTFPASGSTQTQAIAISVNGDVVKEANEVFRVNLSGATGGATITDATGYGVIRDEDRSYFADFDDDLKADYSVHRQSEQRFYVLRSTDFGSTILNFGAATDVAVPGDYDGDGKTDIALYRPSTATYYVINSSTNTVKGLTVGAAGDTPVQGDYNGDGRTDLATFRPATGLWSILFINDGSSTAVNFGLTGDRPVQADYDGDAKTDVAVYRDGTWYILRSSDSSVAVANWGLATDKPVSGDFDGDGRFDLAVYRNGQWWITFSLNGNTGVIAWGLATDVTAAADYDGDGTTDVAIFRPSDGDWYVLQSSTNTITGVHWGISTDAPIPNRYLPQ